MRWSGKIGSLRARRVDSKDMGSGCLGGDPRHYPKQLAPMRLKVDENDNSTVQIE